MQDHRDPSRPRAVVVTAPAVGGGRPRSDVRWGEGRRVWDSPWMHVQEKDGWHRVVTANGGSVAVPTVGVPGDPDCLAVMVRVPRPATGRVMLEFPRGGRDRGETFADAAVRETLEESGHAATDPGPTLVGVVAADSGLLGTPNPVFVVPVEAAASAPTDREAAEVVLVPWRSVPALVRREGCCGVTLSAWLVVEDFLRDPAPTTDSEEAMAFLAYDPSHETDHDLPFDASWLTSGPPSVLAPAA